jgi:tripartite-type tricarboxylate transporter receptor subunit TctC
VPFATGGNLDITARVMAKEMESVLGQPLIIDNRVGAGGVVGAGFVAKAPPDGYTFMINGLGPIVIASIVQKDLPYDPQKELGPLSLVFESPIYISARTGTGLNSLKDLVASAKANPGKLTVSHPSTAGGAHLGIELFKQEAGIDIQAVGYKGEAPAVVDFIGGRLDLTTANIAVIGPHIKSGAAKILVQLGATRAPSLPDVPTAAESGFPGAVTSVWAGMNVPAGTPAEVVGRLNAAVVAAVKSSSVQQNLANFGQVPIGSGIEAYAEFLRRERAKWTPIVTKLDLRS